MEKMEVITQQIQSRSGLSISLGRIIRGFQILLVERRLPGRLYQVYFGILNRFGCRLATIRLENGFVIKAFTHCITMFYEVWNKKDYDVPGFALGEGMTVLDIGANQGFFSLYAASAGATVYAFEPCAENFEILNWNLKRNSMERRVRVYNQAVAGTNGKVKFFVGLDASEHILSGSPSICNSNRGGNGVAVTSVQSRTLDSVFEDLHIVKCDFLKMDCEGAEYEILANTSQDSFDKISTIAMEFHSARGDEAVKILRKAGFEIVFFMGGETGLLKARNLRSSPYVASP